MLIADIHIIKIGGNFDVASVTSRNYRKINFLFLHPHDITVCNDPSCFNSLTSHNYVNIIDQIIPLVFNSDGEPILVLPKLLVASFRWFFLESSTLRLSTSTATSLDLEYALIVMFSQGLCCWLCLTPVNKILGTLKQ